LILVVNSFFILCKGENNFYSCVIYVIILENRSLNDLKLSTHYLIQNLYKNNIHIILNGDSIVVGWVC